MKSFLGLLLLVFFTLPVQSQNESEVKGHTHIKSILVPEPSENPVTNRELIITALNQAEKGDTIQFSSGVYLIGKKIQIDMDGLTLKGDSNGTIIRGCNPENFTEPIDGLLNCGGFELIGQGQTVENFIFEYAWHGLMIGCCLPDDMAQLESGSNIKKDLSGGHTIQHNTFRYNSTGIRVIGINPKTVIIKHNIFQDNYHGLTINGSNASIEKNKFFALAPERIPIDGAIDNAIGILPFSSMFPPNSNLEFKHDCSKIVIRGNTIENILNDIRISDTSECSDIIMEENEIKRL